MTDAPPPRFGTARLPARARVQASFVQLRPRLLALLGERVDGLWGEWTRAGRANDMAGFLEGLLAGGHISRRTFWELEAAGGVEVCPRGQLPPTARLLRPPPELLQPLPAASPEAGGAAATVAARDPLETMPAPSPPGPTGPAGPTPPAERLELLGPLGQGGMAEVFVARDRALGRRVAFKRMHADKAGPALAQRFLAEVQITAQLEHPHVVPIYDLDLSEGQPPGYAMKLVHGKALDEVLDEARARVREGRPRGADLQVATFLEHFLKACDAVAFAHGKGVLHRDLKPANVMIGAYREVYVVDWGIAKILGGPDDDAELVALAEQGDAPAFVEQTSLGAAVGTPAYMSPEQAGGRSAELDARSDVYALGLILFELVSLRRARTGENALSVLGRAVLGDLEPLTPLDPAQRIPRELRAVIARATAVEPGERYPSATALAEDVRRYLRNEEVRARPDTPLQRLVRLAGRNVPAVLAGVLAVVSLAIGGASWSQVQRLEAEAQAVAREQRLTGLLTAVGRQAEELGAHLKQIKLIVNVLANSVLQALLFGTESDEPIYTNDDFLAPAGALKLEDAPSYGRPTSFMWPVHVVAPGLEPEELLSLARRLAPLRQLAPAWMHASDADGVQEAGPVDLRRALAHEGVPVSWLNVGLAEGLLWMMPGQAFDAPFDVRERPWYRAALDGSGERWGRTYVEGTTRRTVLPCSTALRHEGRLLGVVGADLTLEDLIALMQLPDLAGFERSYLVDAQGRIVVSSDDPAGVQPQAAVEAPRARRPFPVPELLPALRSGQAGYVPVTHQGRPVLFVHYPEGATGWQFVVWLDARAALADD